MFRERELDQWKRILVVPVCRSMRATSNNCGSDDIWYSVGMDWSKAFGGRPRKEMQATENVSSSSNVFG